MTLLKMKQISGVAAFIVALALSLSAQTNENTARQRSPGKASRPFVVLNRQSLDELQRKLQPDNKTEELIGGEGMQLRVAVQHERARPTPPPNSTTHPMTFTT
jgi:hypothetical protein